MLVSLKGRWKAPIACFLTDHINSTQLATYDKEAIYKAADNKLIVKTFVGHGLKANMKAAVELGCNIGVENLCIHFYPPHPNHPDVKIYFVIPHTCSNYFEII